MSSRLVRLACAAALASVLPATALRAQIVDVAAVDGKGLFQDTRTGYLWMDLTPFYAQSYAGQLLQLLPGFRPASFNEVFDLTTLSMPNPAGNWANYFSIAGGSNTQNREILWGNYQGADAGNWYWAYDYDGSWYNSVGDANPYPDLGLWAVNTNAVTPAPEPTSMILLATGLVGVLGVRRKWKGNAA